VPEVSPVLAQQLSVKFFAHDPESVELAGFIPIFHRWIQESRLPDRLLIDVADYRHVADGPGVVLIAHEAHYALDREHGPLGLECTRRRDQPGPLEEKLVGGFRDALAACRHLEEDPARPIRFRTDRARVAIVSRRYAPAAVDRSARALRGRARGSGRPRGGRAARPPG